MIHDALAEFGRDRTLIMITHRESTLSLATRIVRIEDGKARAVPATRGERGLSGTAFSRVWPKVRKTCPRHFLHLWGKRDRCPKRNRRASKRGQVHFCPN